MLRLQHGHHPVRIKVAVLPTKQIVLQVVLEHTHGDRRIADDVDEVAFVVVAHQVRNSEHLSGVRDEVVESFSFR